MGGPWAPYEQDSNRGTWLVSGTGSAVESCPAGDLGGETSGGGAPFWSGNWDMGDAQAGWIRAPKLQILKGAKGQRAAEADGIPVCAAMHGVRTDGLLFGPCSALSAND